MANTGYKGYSNLEWYYVGDGAATGVTKPNSAGYADYVAPVYDTTSCPIISLNTYGVTISSSNQSTGFQITSTYSYYDIVSTDSSWLTTNISNGGGNSSVTVDATANSNGYDRYAEISIVVNGVTIASFAVTQSA